MRTRSIHNVIQLQKSKDDWPDRISQKLKSNKRTEKQNARGISDWMKTIRSFASLFTEVQLKVGKNRQACLPLGWFLEDYTTQTNGLHNLEAVKCTWGLNNIPRRLPDIGVCHPGYQFIGVLKQRRVRKKFGAIVTGKLNSACKTGLPSLDHPSVLNKIVYGRIQRPFQPGLPRSRSNK